MSDDEEEEQPPMLEEEIQNYYEDIQELQNNYMKNQMIY